MRRSIRHFVVLAPACILATGIGCASGSLFHSGPRPPELVGTWIVSAPSTTADTVAWVLASSGDYRTLTIPAQRGGRDISPRSTKGQHYARWYLSGSIADTSRREFCFKQRARDGGSCMRFELDTLPDGRRRLRLLGYVDQEHSRQWVLTERKTQ